MVICCAMFVQLPPRCPLAQVTAHHGIALLLRAGQRSSLTALYPPVRSPSKQPPSLLTAQELRAQLSMGPAVSSPVFVTSPARQSTQHSPHACKPTQQPTAIAQLPTAMPRPSTAAPILQGSSGSKQGTVGTAGTAGPKRSDVLLKLQGTLMHSLQVGDLVHRMQSSLSCLPCALSCSPCNPLHTVQLHAPLCTRSCTLVLHVCPV